MPVLTRRPVRQKRDPRTRLAKEFLKGIGLTLKRAEDVARLRGKTVDEMVPWMKRAEEAHAGVASNA